MLLPLGVNPTAVNKYIIYHIISYHISSYHHIASRHIISYHIISSESNRTPNVHVPRATMLFSSFKKFWYQILHIFKYHSLHEILLSHIKMCYCYLVCYLYSLICTYVGKSLRGYTCEGFVCRYDSVRMYRVVGNS